eukprot:6787642-Prymnesium_polylepis.2
MLLRMLSSSCKHAPHAARALSAERPHGPRGHGSGEDATAAAFTAFAAANHRACTARKACDARDACARAVARRARTSTCRPTSPSLSAATSSKRELSNASFASTKSRSAASPCACLASLRSECACFSAL